MALLGRQARVEQRLALVGGERAATDHGLDALECEIEAGQEVVRFWKGGKFDHRPPTNDY